MIFKISIQDTLKYQFMKIFRDFYNFVRLTVLIIVSVKNNIQHHIKYIYIGFFYINGYIWKWKMGIPISQMSFIWEIGNYIIKLLY